jgi:hypothetical protein
VHSRSEWPLHSPNAHSERRRGNRQIVAGQVLPPVEVGSSYYEKGAFNTLWQELTALEHSAFKKRMATALTECPLGTSKRKQIVAGQVLPAAEVGSTSYIRGAFTTLWQAGEAQLVVSSSSSSSRQHRQQQQQPPPGSSSPTRAAQWVPGGGGGGGQREKGGGGGAEI